MTPLSASKLRSNIYRILDKALETGVPVEINRNGRRLIVADAATSGERLLTRDRTVRKDYESAVW